MKRIQNYIVYTIAHVLRKNGVNFNEESNPYVQEMRRAFDALDNQAINFKVETYPNGSWSAESTNVDGIMTGGADPRDIAELIKDATYTYFEIPPHACKDGLVRSDNEPVTVERTIHVGA